MAPSHAVAAVGSDMAAISSQMAPIWLAMQNLLAQADHQPLQALAGLGQILPPVLQIVGHRLVLHDGPGDQLGEQRHIRAEVDDVPLGRHRPRYTSMV